MSQIKICGLRRIEDVQAVNQFMPDYIGFIFANTRRFITDETAAYLKENLDSRIQAVGVFVNEPIERIVKLVFEKSIDVIQLHGQEDLDYVNQLRGALSEKIGSQAVGEKTRVPLIKVVRIDASVDVTKEEKEKIVAANQVLIEDAKLCNPEFLLFDSKVKGILGGSGQNFDIAGLPSNEEIGLPYFLAGGVDFSNVEDLIHLRKPYGIDVSSCVETDGWKDSDKIKSMISVVRNAK